MQLLDEVATCDYVLKTTSNILILWFRTKSHAFITMHLYFVSYAPLAHFPSHTSKPPWKGIFCNVINFILAPQIKIHKFRHNILWDKWSTLLRSKYKTFSKWAYQINSHLVSISVLRSLPVSVHHNTHKNISKQMHKTNFFFHKMSRLLSLVLLFICLFIIKLHFLIIRKHAFESNFSRILQVFKLVFTLSPKHTTKCLHCAAYQN